MSGFKSAPEMQGGRPASPAAARPAQWNREPLEGVKRIVAVASGKGGVGKSTVAVNLARALTALGKRAGLLDADIHGPSAPRMLGLSGKPEVRDGKLVPLAAEGVACLSMGLIAGEGAVVWRGPMLAKALAQMLRGADWGDLDFLLIDLPPGTGDVQISLAQLVPLTGAVIVTTPQEVAAQDAFKCAEMFIRLGVPLLGVVENMSWFADPAGTRHRLFGQGGGARLAERVKAPYLGEIPLDPAIGSAADAGKAPPEELLEIYRAIARRLPW